MACVTADRHTGQTASGPWQMWAAQSTQKSLWPQGTRAAMTCLSMHWMQVSCPLAAEPRPGRKDRKDSGGEEEEAVLSPEEEEEKVEL